jgi:putative endonuclease
MSRNPERMASVSSQQSKGYTTLSSSKDDKTVPWFVYILSCSDRSYYVGISPDVEKRVKLHNDGKAAIHTKLHRPVILIYKQQFSSKSEARKREMQIKGWSRIKKEKLIRHEYE